VAPDGAGPSLAKIDEDGATGRPRPTGGQAARWAVPRHGQTRPAGMRVNLTLPPSRLGGAAVALPLRYPARIPARHGTRRGTTTAAGARGLALFYGGTAGWRPTDTQAVVTLYSSGLDAAGQALTPGQADPHYALTASAYSTPPPPAISATVMANHPAWLATTRIALGFGVVARRHGECARRQLPVPHHLRSERPGYEHGEHCAAARGGQRVDERLSERASPRACPTSDSMLQFPVQSHQAVSFPAPNTLDFAPSTTTDPGANPAGSASKPADTAGKLAADEHRR